MHRVSFISIGADFVHTFFVFVLAQDTFQEVAANLVEPGGAWERVRFCEMATWNLLLTLQELGHPKEWGHSNCVIRARRRWRLLAVEISCLDAAPFVSSRKHPHEELARQWLVTRSSTELDVHQSCHVR